MVSVHQQLNYSANTMTESTTGPANQKYTVCRTGSTIPQVTLNPEKHQARASCVIFNTISLSPMTGSITHAACWNFQCLLLFWQPPLALSWVCWHALLGQQLMLALLCVRQPAVHCWPAPALLWLCWCVRSWRLLNPWQASVEVCQSAYLRPQLSQALLLLLVCLPFPLLQNY
jgi:hypothetical protein